jgi:hypothetical protein
MKTKSKKISNKLRIPSKVFSAENVFYIVIVTTLIFVLIYFLKPSIVVPTRIKPIYRDYIPKWFSNFTFFFYSILVVPSAFKPIWFIFWPLSFYIFGKKFFKNKKIKYFLAVIGLLLSYFFYAIPNHCIVPLLFTYKPTEFKIDQEFPELCSEKNLMVFAPPDIYDLNSEQDPWYLNFKEDWSKYVGTSVHYICVGNGTSVIVSSFDWNPKKLYCPSEIKLEVSGEKYNEILSRPPSLFPMFVFNCEYVVSPYENADNRKHWIDIFCFNSGFATPRCLLHLLNPSTGPFLPPENIIVSTK